MPALHVKGLSGGIHFLQARAGAEFLRRNRELLNYAAFPSVNLSLGGAHRERQI